MASLVNLSQEPLTDERVRQAVSYGVNRKAILDGIYFVRAERGELTLEQLMAFAVTSDASRQEQVYNRFVASWGRAPQPHAIRDPLLGRP